MNKNNLIEQLKTINNKLEQNPNILNYILYEIKQKKIQFLLIKETKKEIKATLNKCNFKVTKIIDKNTAEVTVTNVYGETVNIVHVPINPLRINHD